MSIYANQRPQSKYNILYTAFVNYGRQQMRRTKRGAHLLLRVRTRTLNEQ